VAFLSKIVVRSLQGYWRLTRALTLIAEACIIDAENRIALSKTATGWSLPHTTVRQGEALEDALRRLLKDECGVEATAIPSLFWTYAETAPAGQTGVFVIRQWMKTPVWQGSQLAFFDCGAFPAGLDDKDAARIREAIGDRTPFEVC
jgi:ADP-ribose pyrophosphatase YjhB (NUDIX family)